MVQPVTWRTVTAPSAQGGGGLLSGASDSFKMATDNLLGATSQIQKAEQNKLNNVRTGNLNNALSDILQIGNIEEYEQKLASGDFSPESVAQNYGDVGKAGMQSILNAVAKQDNDILALDTSKQNLRTSEQNYNFAAENQGFKRTNQGYTDTNQAFAEDERERVASEREATKFVTGAVDAAVNTQTAQIKYNYDAGKKTADELVEAGVPKDMLSLGADGTVQLNPNSNLPDALRTAINGMIKDAEANKVPVWTDAQVKKMSRTLAASSGVVPPSTAASQATDYLESLRTPDPVKKLELDIATQSAEAQNAALVAQSETALREFDKKNPVTSPDYSKGVSSKDYTATMAKLRESMHGAIGEVDYSTGKPIDVYGDATINAAMKEVQETIGAGYTDADGKVTPYPDALVTHVIGKHMDHIADMGTFAKYLGIEVGSQVDTRLKEKLDEGMRNWLVDKTTMSNRAALETSANKQVSEISAKNNSYLSKLLKESIYSSQKGSSN